jgi:catechol-2,3-dioxygenase
MAIPLSSCAISRFAWIRENFDNAQDDLRTRGIAFEFQDHAVSQSIYFEDPDGLRLELTTYEV